jgi:hypothetical protein
LRSGCGSRRRRWRRRVGQNLGDLLKRYAGQIYGGIVAIISLVFLLNRRYAELGLFFIAAVLLEAHEFARFEVAAFTPRDPTSKSVIAAA